jgi:5-methylcytosine-specific restriction endonuclease McrA
VSHSLEQRVRERAKNRCEYCKVPAYFSESTFPLDHIIAEQHGGKTIYDNLALSCPPDNLHKGPTEVDPII